MSADARSAGAVRGPRATAHAASVLPGARSGTSDGLTGAQRLPVRVLRALRAVRWYVRELMGDSAYERYRDRHQREHPGHPPMTEREFWRARDADRTTGPGCC